MIVNFEACVHLGLHPYLVRRLLHIDISVELLAVGITVDRVLPVGALQIIQTMAIGGSAVWLFVDLLHNMSWVLLHGHQRRVLESFILAPIQ